MTKLAASAADDLASQSIKMTAAADDIAVMTSKAAIKTAGVAGDDLAVGVSQVAGISPSRELPALWRVSKGSLFNKVWLAALLLTIDHYAPSVISGVLVFGALYLAYEAGEGLIELFRHRRQPAPASDEDTAMSEDEKVQGAIRTDIVLSFELLVIALTAAGAAPIEQKVAVLVVVGLLMTVGVYGLIAIIIRLDDMGLALSRSEKPWRQRLGRRMVEAAPVILRALGPIGIVAMLAVAGGILNHAVNVRFPNWLLGLAGDVSLGAAIGLTLAGIGNWIAKLRS
ncbi:DUF808 family protein [Burkholderia ubonensis]|uniref:DUF808 family protein n=1 Tax=Burkholderia ubonensis TaxID=101571 RepID=UPI0012F9D2AE|nr:DUF808 family protein [Burkholderia ubonensis]